MKLKLFICDIEEGTISFRDPVLPTECEVDISDMLHEEEFLLPTLSKNLNSQQQRGIMYIVEIESGCYLSSWGGDPGRTVLIESAKRFLSERSAKLALKKARIFRKFNDAKIICIDTKEERSNVYIVKKSNDSTKPYPF